MQVPFFRWYDVKVVFARSVVLEKKNKAAYLELTGSTRPKPLAKVARRASGGILLGSTSESSDSKGVQIFLLGDWWLGPHPALCGPSKKWIFAGPGVSLRGVGS